MANEFVARNGIIAKDNSTITGTLAVSGNITMGGLLVATQSWVTTRGYATESYVTTAINDLIGSAPGALNTLNELAAALGDDPNFATTVTNSIATKVPQTRTLTINGTAFDLSADRSWTISSADGYISDVRLVETTLTFEGEGNAFAGDIDLSTLPFAPQGSYLTAEADTLATVVSRGSTTSSTISVLETTGGGFLFRTNSSWGSWARNGFSFADGSGTPMKSLGAYGDNGTSLGYMYFGTDYQTNTFRIYDNYVYVPGLDLAMSNSNSDHGVGTYFRGDGAHFVLGLRNGNTFYLNYGNDAGALRTYGTWQHHDVQILSTSRVLTNVSGNISMFTNDSGYITGYTETDTLATVTGRGASTSTAVTFNGGATISGTGGDGSEVLRLTGSASDAFNYSTASVWGNLTAGETVAHVIGKAESQYNTANFGYRHVADGSSSNHVTIGMFQADNLLNILGNGNVGIGTTAPTDKLHVFGTINVGDNKVYNGASNNSAGFELIGSRFNIHGYHGITFNASNAAIGSQTERMRITSAGNVGIGTTSPAQKLDVNGYAKFTSGIILDGGATSHYREFIWNTSGFNRWDLYVHGAEPGSNVGGDLFLARYADNGAYLANTVTFQRSTGNVGIGTTSPLSALDVRGNISLDRDRYIFFGGNIGTTGEYIYEKVPGTIAIHSGSSDAIVFPNNGTFIYTPLNIGIGTDNPQHGLHVSKNQNQVAAFQSPNPNTWIDLISTAGTWSMGATSSNTWAIYQRGAVNALEFEVSESAAFISGEKVATQDWVTSQGYLTSETDSQTLDWNQGEKTLTISNGNTVTLEGLVTEEYVTSQGYITGYTETDPVYVSERDSLQLNKTLQPTLLFSTLEHYNKPSGYSTMIQPSSYQNPLPSHGYYHIIARRDTGGGYGALLQSYNTHELYHGNTTQNTSDISWYKIWTSGDFTSTNVTNWNTAYGWGNHASAGYATTGYVDTAIANLVDTAPDALDTLNELAAALGNDQNFATTVTNSIATKLPLTGGTLSGDLTVGAVGKTSDTVVRSLADQSYKAGFEAYGNGQGTGYFYAGQSLDYGGGFSYNGDNSPGFISGETADNITFFRREAGTSTEVFHYAYSNNDVYFNGAVVASGSNSNNWNTAYGWGNNYISDVILSEYNLEFTGEGSAFTGTIDLSGLPFQPAGSYLTSETDTLATVTGRGSSTTSSITVNGSLLALNNGVTNAYTTASNGRLYLGSSAQNDYSIYTHMEDFGGNYTKLTLDWHTGIKIGASQGYGGIRFYNDAINNGGVKLFSVGEGDAHVRVENNLYVGNTIYNNGNAVIHAGNIGSQSVSYATSAGSVASATNLSGLGLIQSTSTGTSYQNNYQVRENAGGGSNTNEIYAPQLAFHWSGVVASSIMMEASGRIAIRNNPGGSYENFAAAVITATGGNSTNWNTAYGWGNHADYGYWVLENTEPKNVQAPEVIFTGNVTVEGTFTESSSIRFKENIVDLESSTEKVEQLRPVRYNKIGVEEEEIGLIAEEVAEIYPEVVTYNEEGEPTGVNYTRLSVILLKSVQELAERINKLENK
jgi:hypothetical protein